MPLFEKPARAALLALLLLTYLPESNEAIMHLARNVPYADDALARADAAIGFDWLAYLRWFDAHPFLWAVCSLAYWSIWDQMLAVGLVLMLLESHARLCTFFGAQAVSLALTCVLAGAFPAIGAYLHYDAAHLSLAHAMGETVSYHMVPTLEWVRAPVWTPAPAHLYHGVVSFPSYHAICCITCAWAFWGVRWLRWPACAFNLAMFAATPVQGAHYVVDLIAGVAIAGASIVAVGATVRSERVGALPSYLVRMAAGRVGSLGVSR